MSREEYSHDQVAPDFSDETEVDFVNKTETKKNPRKKYSTAVDTTCTALTSWLNSYKE